MKAYQVNFPAYTVGSDAYQSVNEVCNSVGQNVLLLGGEKALLAGETLLRASINPSQIQINFVHCYGHDCTKANMEQWANFAKEEKITAIFAMGGGKALDTAKGAAFLAGIPVFTFPTIAATCAATTKLSVVYKDDGSFDEFAFYDMPPKHCFIDLNVIAHAPSHYFRAGIGDTIGKYFECHFSARNDVLDHSSLLGRQISNLCYEPLLLYGKLALEDCKKNLVSEALTQATLAIIVSTGLVSLLVLDEYNCAIAHSVYYGLVILPGFEENYLHGDVVAYGVLVQLLVDGERDKAVEVKNFMQSLGMPTTLKEMQEDIFNQSAREAYKGVLREIVDGPDMSHIPYPVSEDMIWNAMLQVENLN